MDENTKIELKAFCKHAAIVLVQLAVLLFCLIGISAGVFIYFVENCSNWIWGREISLFIELIKDPFLSFLGNDDQMLFRLAGSLAVSVVILSVVACVLFLNLIFSTLCYSLEKMLIGKPAVKNKEIKDEKRAVT